MGSLAIDIQAAGVEAVLAAMLDNAIAAAEEREASGRDRAAEPEEIDRCRDVRLDRLSIAEGLDPDQADNFTRRFMHAWCHLPYRVRRAIDPAKLRVELVRDLSFYDHEQRRRRDPAGVFNAGDYSCRFAAKWLATMPDDAVVGVILHELGHAFLFVTEGEPACADEARVDALAKEWAR